MWAIPNILTIARIIGSVLLLFVHPFSPSFIAIYLFCGISDFLDGFVARRYELTTSFGAILDSIADFVFVFIALYVILPVILLPTWILGWIAIIIFVKVCSLLIGALRYKALTFLHTYLNKITGAMLFGFVMLYSVFGLNMTAVVLCFVATVAAVEEFIINLTQKELQGIEKAIL